MRSLPGESNGSAPPVSRFGAWPAWPAAEGGRMRWPSAAVPIAPPASPPSKDRQRKPADGDSRAGSIQKLEARNRWRKTFHRQRSARFSQTEGRREQPAKDRAVAGRYRDSDAREDIE